MCVHARAHTTEEIGLLYLDLFLYLLHLYSAFPAGTQDG